MTRLLFTLVGWGFFSLALSSQNTFLKTYGGAGKEEGYQIITLSDGSGYLACGSSESTGSGDQHGFLLRIDPAGTVLWQRFYDTPLWNIFLNVVEANDGGFIVMGMAYRDTIAVNTIGEDLFALKVDSVGQLVWSQRFGAPFSEDNFGDGKIIKLSDGYIIGGIATDRTVMIRMTNNGNVIWQRGFGPPPHMGQDVHFYPTHLEGDTLYCVGDAYKRDGCLARINIADGDLIDLKYYEATLSYNDQLCAIALSTDNNFVLAGQATISGSGYQNWLLKTEKDGNVLWSKTYKISNALQPSPDIQTTGDGGYLVAPRNNTADLFKVDADGNVLWGYTYGDTSARFFQVCPTADHGFIAIGTANTLADKAWDLLVVKVDSAGYVGGCCQKPIDQIVVADRPVALIPYAAVDFPYSEHLPWQLTSIPTNFPTKLFCQALADTTVVTISFCSGETVYVQNQPYTDSGDIALTLGPPSNCNIIYHLKRQEPVTKTETYILPEDFPILFIRDQVYFEPDTLLVAVPSTTGGCDSLITYYIQKAPPPNPDPCLPPPTFLKTFGNPDQTETAASIIPSRDGHLYGYGQIDNGRKFFIQKIRFNGEQVWVRSFLLDSTNTFRPTQLIEDSEGMLVGCGRYEYAAAKYKGLVFRYDPVADAVLWVNIIESDGPQEAGVLEKTPGGNFLYYHNPNPGHPFYAFDPRMEILELSRTTGQIIPGFAQRYSYIYVDRLTKMVTAADGSLYGIGVVTGKHDYPPTSRVLLARFDTLDGTPLWARLSDTDTTALTTVSSLNTTAVPDLIVDGNTLVSVYPVDDDVSDWPLHNNQEYTHLQKSDLDGNIIWVRRYDTEVRMELMLLPDGYLLYNNTKAVKVDKDGAVLWSKVLPLIPLGGQNNISFNINSAVRVEDSLYFFGGYRLKQTLPNPTYNEVYLLKMYTDGTMQDSCGYVQSLAVTMTNVPDPVSTPIVLQYAAAPAIAVAATLSKQPETLEEHFLCPEYAPVTLACPSDIEVAITGASDSILINYDLPIGSTGCACPGVALTRTGGLESGSLFPSGTTQVCYSGTDSCGTSAACCFKVKVRKDTCQLVLSLGPDTGFCPNHSATLTATPGFLTYTWQDGSGDSTFTASTPGLYWVEVTDTCGGTQRDSILLSLLPMPADTATFEFCPGDFVTIDGQVYSQPGTVLDTLASGTGGCDTLLVYLLNFLPLPTLNQVVEFCPGSSVSIGGALYTQPGTVVDTLPAATGCDTIATYILQYYTLPQPSTLSMTCPPSQTLEAPAGANFVVVNYDLPLVNTDCVCGGAGLSLNQGPISGGNFPVGVNTICYAAEDSCGTSQTCCFTVTVNPAPAGDTACDVKTIGCLQYELLGISANFHQDRKYRIRVTNTCAAKMIYTVFEVPQGETAMAPANNSVYTAPSGSLYDVRNPNFQPFYSIRFKSKTDSIVNGQSDIFEYQLPSQIAPSYIHVSSRLVPNTFYEAYLNTFHCPIENGAKPAGERGAFARQVSVFPNPTSGELFADLSAWQGQSLRLRVLDAQGRDVWTANTVAGSEAFQINLSQQLADGLFTLDVITESGERDVVRFVLEK